MSIFKPSALIGACICGMLLSACAQPVAAPAAKPNSAADLGAIKTYLTGKTAELKASTGALKASSDRYYELAKAKKFDYAALFASDKAVVIKLIEDARGQWMTASPQYEQMEGIVAGVPSLADYDKNLDAGASQAEGGDGVVDFDIPLPDGRKLEKPGNLFGVTESALWGTFDAFTAPGVFDFNGDGAAQFGESLPEANVLKGSVDLLHDYAQKLDASAAAWQPAESDAFQALVTMIPTMSEYFDSWKGSRFIAGDASTQRDFVAISRLADIVNILGSLQVVHTSVSPLIAAKNPTEDAAISKGLTDLKAFVGDVYEKEKGGKKYSPEEADILGKEAQDRATAVTGKVAQMAGALGIKLSE